jgi:hypothetical protein
VCDTVWQLWMIWTGAVQTVPKPQAFTSMPLV